jgi:hypothetical protein
VDEQEPRPLRPQQVAISERPALTPIVILTRARGVDGQSVRADLWGRSLAGGVAQNGMVA